RFVGRSAKLLRCPICGSKVPWAELRGYTPVKCPSCKEWVCVPKSYLRRQLALSHALTVMQILSLIASTHRGWVVFLYAPIFFVNAFVVGALSGAFFPPTVEISQPDPGFSGPLGLNTP
ncbi:MAG: hypothetical protein ACJ71N_05045, partial [Terriglobales bacterium]